MGPNAPDRAARSVLVLTASDRSASGERPDASGELLAARLAGLGFAVERRIVADDVDGIAAAIVAGAREHRLVITTGGTGLTPRDVTPQATAAILDYAIPGIAEAMRAEGRRSTPLAALSRGLVGVRQGSLIANLPGSPRGSMESFEVLVPLLDHALETLAGSFDHAAARAAGRLDLPPGLPEDA
jgi:molybdenum cofactor synthesis domain-containing protein